MRSVLDPTVPLDVGVLSQRQRIVDAMIESCAEKTYSGTTIADIVRRASISRTTFYKRFADKRECFDSALEHCIEALRMGAAASHLPSDPPPEAVRKAATAILRLMADRPPLAHLVMGEAVSVEPAITGRYRRILIPALEDLWASAGEPMHSHSDPRLAFGRAQVLILDQIAAGKTGDLPSLLPEIVYIALLPFAGHDEAVLQARLAGGESADGSPKPVDR